MRLEIPAEHARSRRQLVICATDVLLLVAVVRNRDNDAPAPIGILSGGW
jgi:hypothetical protein